MAALQELNAAEEAEENLHEVIWEYFIYDKRNMCFYYPTPLVTSK